MPELPTPPPLTIHWLGKGGLSEKRAYQWLRKLGVLRSGDSVGSLVHQDGDRQREPAKDA